MKENLVLAKALKSNDPLVVERAFEAIYNKYSSLLLYISLQIVKRNDVAEELVNDTFLKFFNNINKIDFKRNIKYWLVTTVKNASLDYLKTQKKNLVLSNEVVLSFPDESKRDNHREIINQFKDFLSEEELDIVVYHLIFRCTFREIALKKNQTINAVAGKYKRSLQKIRKHYREVKQ